MAQAQLDGVDYDEELRRRTGGNTGIGDTGRGDPGPLVPAFDASRAPSDVPADWAQDFIRRNPNDYHRISEAYGSERESQRQQQARAFPPFQFDDPYTKQLEDVARNQMGEIRSNPGLDALNKFLESRFNELSTAPGYSQDELALLNTQAFEPIEQLRQAGAKRSLERTAARGFLPSSGLAELDLRDVDRQADELRTRASRDLAVGAIDRRDSDLNTALQLATTRGLTIPQGQRSEELNLANLLYGLPSRALQDALAVVQGSPTAAQLGSQAYNLAQMDQLNRNNNMQRWAQIAQMLAGMFD